MHLKKAGRKLDSAKHLLDGNFYDDAISRAYYSMYHAAKAILSLKDIHPKRHAGVVTMFGLHFVTPGHVEDLYGKALARAQEDREDADYDIYYEADREEAESVIKDAEAFLDRVKKAIKEIEN